MFQTKGIRLQVANDAQVNEASSSRRSLLVDPMSKKGTEFNTGMVSEKNIKSPSDTTIYAPALSRNPEPVQNSYFGNNSQLLCRDSTPRTQTNVSHPNITNQISDFIEGIRMQNEAAGVAGGVVRQQQQQPQQQPQQQQQQQSTSAVKSVISEFDAQVAKAKDKTNRLILEAEKFKASVNAPPGTHNVQHLSNPMIDVANDQVRLVPNVNLPNSILSFNEPAGTPPSP